MYLHPPIYFKIYNKTVVLTFIFLKTVNYPNYFECVGTYVSKNQWDFMNYGAVRCDDLRNPEFFFVFRYQCKRPVIGQYVTVRNYDFTHPNRNPGNYSQMEINEIVILGKCEYIFI